MVEQSKVLEYNICLELIEDAETLMKGNNFYVPSQKILEVARRTGCSGYDSQFIALAEELNADLFTYDNKILNACPEFSQMP